MKAPLRPMLLAWGALSLGGFVFLNNAHAGQPSTFDTAADLAGGKDGGGWTTLSGKDGGSIELVGKDGGSIELVGKDAGHVMLGHKDGGSIELSVGSDK